MHYVVPAIVAPSTLVSYTAVSTSHGPSACAGCMQIHTTGIGRTVTGSDLNIDLGFVMFMRTESKPFSEIRF